MHKGPPIRRVACGADFSMMVDVSGNLFSFGSPEYGQLGAYILALFKRGEARRTQWDRVCELCIYRFECQVPVD